jgi:lysozyme
MIQLPPKPQGPDVASYQGYPDWGLIKSAGYVFGITKFTEGLGYINPTAAHNWQGMKANGFKRFAYHWGRPTQSPQQQFEFFWDTIQQAGGWEDGDCLMLDLEEGEAGGLDEGAWAVQFMDVMDDRIPESACVLYSGLWYIQKVGLDKHPELARYALHDAAYQVGLPPAPAPWDKITLWQYTSSGVIVGIDGPVDINEFQGTYEELAALGRRGGSSIPVPDPTPQYNVGPGIRAKMESQGAVPATNEMDRGEYAEAFDNFGNHYAYVKSLNETFVTWKTA